MAGATSPQTTSAVARVSGIQWNGTLGLRWDWRSEARSTASHTFSLPCLRAHIPSITGLWRRCCGYQGTHLAFRASCFEGVVLRLGEWNAIPEDEPQKCLNMSPFLPLLMSDLRVVGFLFLSFFPPVYPSIGGERVFLVELDFQSTWPLHILKWQFHLGCKMEHLWVSFSVYSIKLYIWGCGKVFVKTP